MAAFQKIILALSVLFFAFLAYVVPLTLRGGTDTAEVVADYYNHYNSRDFAYIRSALLTPEARAAAAEDTLRDAFEKLGRHTGGARKSFKLLNIRKKRFYYRFDAEYEKGNAVDSFVLVKDKDGFRLENLPNDSFPCAR
ncbi:MAG: hypothetical protein A2X32_07530 [Elusimicrobia bacterium GWC2_64_44]|nr:MAG: hypothetical protein A2X32_07530 [Elusimicrobia bacterium GWC2_64_44]